MQRSKKIALISHCILNMNCRIKGSATCPGAVAEVIKALVKADIGIYQLPCPEVTGMGMKRFAGTQPSFDNPGFRRECKNALEPVFEAVDEYLREGYQICAVIGIQGSPTCGIYQTTCSETWDNLGYPSPQMGDLSLTEGSGVFMGLLIEGLKALNCQPKIMELSDRRKAPGKAPADIAQQIASL